MSRMNRLVSVLGTAISKNTALTKSPVFSRWLSSATSTQSAHKASDPPVKVLKGPSAPTSETRAKMPKKPFFLSMSVPKKVTKDKASVSFAKSHSRDSSDPSVLQVEATLFST